MRGESNPSLGVYIHTGLLQCPVEYRLSLNTGKLSQIFINSSQMALEGYSSGLLCGRERNSAAQRLIHFSWFIEGRVQNPVQTLCTDFSCVQAFSISRRECKKKNQHTWLNASWLHPESTSGVISAQPGCIPLRCSPSYLAPPARSSWSKTMTTFEGRQLGVCKGQTQRNGFLLGGTPLRYLL